LGWPFPLLGTIVENRVGRTSAAYIIDHAQVSYKNPMCFNCLEFELTYLKLVKILSTPSDVNHGLTIKTWKATLA